MQEGKWCDSQLQCIWNQSKFFNISEELMFLYGPAILYNNNYLYGVPLVSPPTRWGSKYRNLSTNWAKRRRTGYPILRILIVSNIPVYRNCSSTIGMSNFIGALSELGLMQRTNHGLHLEIKNNKGINNKHFSHKTSQLKHCSLCTGLHSLTSY